MSRVVSRLLAVGLSAALIAGCSADDAGPEQRARDAGTDPAGSSERPEGADADQAETSEVAATATLHLGGGDVDVEVLPIARVDEHAVLTLDLESTSPDAEPVRLADALSGTAVLRVPALSGLRLFDLERDAVHTVAVDDRGEAVSSGEGFVRLEPGGRMRLQAAYAAPPDDVERLGVFLPGGAYLADVPVVSGEVPAAGGPDDASGDAQPLDLDAVVEAPVADLESFTAELGGAVETLSSTEEVRVTLGSDVLFEVDSAELSEEAQQALDAAVEHLEGREPGTVHVVGHTDDVAGDDYNLRLSQRRADAVAAALEQRIDAERFELSTEGRGEREPVVDNVDEASRARNRRVTVTLASEVTRTTEVTTEGELPPFDGGPVGTGAEGVVVEHLGSHRVTAPEARRVDGHIVVDLQVSPQGEDAGAGVSFLSTVHHYRGEAFSVQGSASGLVLVRGATAVYPMDYLDDVSDGGVEQWLPATDLRTEGALAPDGTRTFSVIYPEVGELDEIAVQVGDGLGAASFRLTDIPVR